MSYGQNQPGGLQVWNNLNSSGYNGAMFGPGFYIQSGYANNIFQGDLVYKGTDGYLHNLSDLGVGTYPTATSIGVFNGCAYVQPTANNPIDPASPGRPYWPAGTQTLNDAPAKAMVLIDPNIIYTVQVDDGGLAWTAQSDATASVGYTYVAGSLTNPTGNTLTGQSSLVLNSGSIGTAANLNLRIIGFDPNINNPIPLPGGPPRPFVNVLVVIQNHSYIVRPVGN